MRPPPLASWIQNRPRSSATVIEEPSAENPRDEIAAVGKSIAIRSRSRRRSQSLTVPSRLAVAMVRPSGE